MLFIPGIVHFAAVHQYGVSVRDLATGVDTDVFPQPSPSGPVREFMRRIDGAYAKWPKERLDALKLSAYGTGEDYDREIERITWTVDGRGLAFAVRYSPSRLERGELANLYTVVVCMPRNATWSCDERKLEERMQETGVRLAPDSDGFYRRDDFLLLLRRLLRPRGRPAGRAP